MAKKQAARRTPPKKKAKETIAVSRKGKAKVKFSDPVVEEEESVENDSSEKEAMAKGKAKVKFSDPVVEEEESVENETSGSADEVAEESAEGEESGEAEESGDEEDEDNGEAEEEEDNLDDVVQKATELEVGSKKGNNQDKVSEAAAVQPKPLKVDRTKSKVREVSKKLEVGQSSKRKASETAVVRKRKRAEGKKMKEVDGHGSPAALHYVIEHLSTAQKKDVEDIGFGGLLELKSAKFLHTVIDWLLDHYDTVTRLFLFNRNVHFGVSKHDIYDVFMLPCGGAAVPAISDDPDLLHVWREKFRILPKNDIPLDQVRQEMLKLVHGGPEFKKMFVLFAMGSFLVPTVHKRVDVRLLGAVEDVALIPQLDWCTYVLDRFDEAVNSWKKHSSKSMGGCLMFFQLIYFHRLVWRGEPEPSTLPLIRHWTFEAMKVRMNEECKAWIVHQGFGLGMWDLTTYPVSLHKEKTFYRLSRGIDSTGVQRPGVQETARVPEEGSSSKEKGGRCLTIPLPDDILTDEELHSLYKDDRVLKWYTAKRNQKLVSRLHHEMITQLEADATSSQGGEAQQATDLGEAGASQETFTQALNNTTFYAEFMAMVEAADRSMETVVLPPSFDLGIDLSGVNQARPPRSYELRYVRNKESVAPTAKAVGRPPKPAKKK